MDATQKKHTAQRARNHIKKSLGTALALIAALWLALGMPSVAVSQEMTSLTLELKGVTPSGTDAWLSLPLTARFDVTVNGVLVGRITTSPTAEQLAAGESDTIIINDTVAAQAVLTPVAEDLIEGFVCEGDIPVSITQGEANHRTVFAYAMRGFFHVQNNLPDGTPAAGGEFVVVNAAGEVALSFQTDATGAYTATQALPNGQYQLVQMRAPEGSLLLQTPLSFSINTYFGDAQSIVKLTTANQPAPLENTVTGDLGLQGNAFVKQDGLWVSNVVLDGLCAAENSVELDDYTVTLAPMELFAADGEKLAGKQAVRLSQLSIAGSNAAAFQVQPLDANGKAIGEPQYVAQGAPWMLEGAYGAVITYLNAAGDTAMPLYFQGGTVLARYTYTPVATLTDAPSPDSASLTAQVDYTFEYPGVDGISVVKAESTIAPAALTLPLPDGRVTVEASAYASMREDGTPVVVLAQNTSEADEAISNAAIALPAGARVMTEALDASLTLLRTRQADYVTFDYARLQAGNVELPISTGTVQAVTLWIADPQTLPPTADSPEGYLLRALEHGTSPVLDAYFGLRGGLYAQYAIPLQGSVAGENASTEMVHLLEGSVAEQGIQAGTHDAGLGVLLRAQNGVAYAALTDAEGVFVIEGDAAVQSGDLFVVLPDNVQSTATGTLEQETREDVALPQSGLAITYTRLSGLAGRIVTDAGEPIEGAVLTLSQAEETTRTTTSDQKGAYAFHNIGAGDYDFSLVMPEEDNVSITSPDGFIRQGSGAHLLSDVSFAAGQALTLDITAMQLGVVRGQVSEQGMPVEGMTVTLRDGAGQTATAQTDAAGSYAFVNLPAGEYQLTLTMPAGKVATIAGSSAAQSVSELTIDYPIEKGETYTEEILLESTVTLTGRVARLGGGQQIAAASVSRQLTATTAQDGSFAFEGLTSGDYTIYAPLPEGSTLLEGTAWQVSQKGDTIWLTVHVGSESDQALPEAAYVAMTSIEGVAFMDDDGDHVKHETESLMSGIPVALQRMDGGVWTDVADTRTDVYGQYAFESLQAGEYRVVSQTAGGLSVMAIGGGATVLGEPALGIIAGETLRLENGDTLRGVADIALGRSASINVAAFADSNENGTRGEYERALSGVRVALVPAATPEADAIAEVLTSSDGLATLSDVPAGEYVLRVTLPEGYRYTVKGNGNTLNDSCVGDSDSLLATSAPITLRSGQTTEAGIAAIPVGSFSGKVWNDRNYNGVLDADEAGVAGVILTLKGAKTGKTYTLVTDETGEYRFTQLRNDTYALTTQLPENMLFTRYTQTGGNSRSVFTVDGTSATREFVVSGAQDVTDMNVGVLYGATVTGIAFLDTQYDGFYDQTDPPYAKVTLELIRNSNEKSMGKVVTDESGRYTFTGLRPGSYRLRAILPDDGSIFTWVPQTGDGLYNQFVAREGRRENSIAQVMVTDGETVETCVGLAMGASISGVVSLDPKYDGVRGNSDKKLSGVRIQLVDAAGEVTMTDTTNANGRYTLTGIMPGVYTVRIQRKDGHAFTRYRPDEAHGNHIKTLAKDGYGETEPITVTMGQEITDIDAGMLPSSTLSGVFFDDLNDNGLQDEGEGGFVTGSVRLRSEDGEIDLIETVDQDGAYFFDGVMPGTYTITYRLPTHATLATVAQGGNTLAPQGQENTLEGFTVESGKAYTAPLVGGVTLGSFTGTAYHDANGNGIQDADEPSMQGVRVTITRRDGNREAIEAESDAQGQFALSGIRPGEYALALQLPEGYILSADIAQSGLSLPAANRASISLPWDALVNRAVNFIGLVKPASITASVWLDEDRDGAYSDNERLFGGLGYELYDELKGTVVKTAYAGDDGYVTFTDVRPSTYTVRFTIPEHAQPSSGSGTFVKQGTRMAHTGIVILEGEEFSEIDGGLVSYTSIGGRIALEEGGTRTPQAGVDVFLYTENANEPIQTQQTDENGAYRFDGLWPDHYRIGVALPTGLVFVRPDDSNYAEGTSAVSQTREGIGYSEPIALAMARHLLSTDVLLIKPARVGAQVWLDTNANGLIDADEPTINGVAIQLLTNGQVTYITISNEWGYYEFADVYPGTYTVTAQAYPELEITAAIPSLAIISSCLTQGNGENASSEPFTVVSGQRSSDRNLGYVLPDGQSMPEAIKPGSVQSWIK